MIFRLVVLGSFCQQYNNSSSTQAVELQKIPENQTIFLALKYIGTEQKIMKIHQKLLSRLKVPISLKSFGRGFVSVHFVYIICVWGSVSLYTDNPCRCVYIVPMGAMQLKDFGYIILVHCHQHILIYCHVPPLYPVLLDL